MKTREFELKNYKDRFDRWASNKATEQLPDTVKVGNISIAVEKRVKSSWRKNYWEESDSKLKKEFEKDMKKDYEEKKKATIKRFNDLKKKADFILKDDKDYLELIEVLKDSYYCQATTMIDDLLIKRLESKSARSVKYNARALQFNDEVSCD